MFVVAIRRRWKFGTDNGPFNRVECLIQIERLGEVVERPALNGFDRGGQVAVSRDDNYCRVRGSLLEFAESGESVHAGKSHVEKHSVRRLSTGGRKPVLGSRRDGGSVPLSVARLSQRPGDGLLVVDDQHGGGHTGMIRGSDNIPACPC